MAFKIAKSPTYKSKVTVHTPNDKGGFTKEEFTAVFKRVDLDELDGLRQVPGREVLTQVLVGWDDFLDEENKPVPFDEDTQAALLNQPQAFQALVESFWGSIIKAKEKN